MVRKSISLVLAVILAIVWFSQLPNLAHASGTGDPNKLYPHAQAALSCYGRTCGAEGGPGKDPYAYSCVATSPAPIPDVMDGNLVLTTGGYNYYSAGCNSNWGAVTKVNATGIQIIVSTLGTDQYESDRGCYLGVDVTDYYYPGGGGIYSGPLCTGFATGAGTSWGNMVDGTTQVQVCIKARSPSGRVLSQCKTQ
ncbi:hypothetical protein KDA_11850 [Dictyobacter alpinus]|uniref:Uncharacterized protein n=1 Tax=Dictyobacter alpinus TaxID=2014873 RepID=A0A402B2X3_9CHLR|nr:hypothetical protein [Dictyobacter alpinus]GCE25701.1 hypothetical protein KDA_11850 [Dictyobacter alpinus]